MELWYFTNVLETKRNISQSKIQRSWSLGDAKYFNFSIYNPNVFAISRCFDDFWIVYRKQRKNIFVLPNFPFGRCFIGVYGVLIREEKLSGVLHVIPQRLVYRWLRYVVLFRSLRKALKGEMQTWGFLKRTGNVKEPVVVS